MHTADNLIAEFNVKAAEIEAEHLQQWKEKNIEAPDKKMDNFMDVFVKFQKALAGEATMILHKSIMEGVDDTTKILEGVRNINLETAQSLMTEIRNTK
jgi:hypothetical protein